MLKSLREERNWTRKVLMKQFTETAQSLGLGHLSVTEKTIERWEGPTPPQPRAGAGQVLERLFGRSLVELGFLILAKGSPEKLNGRHRRRFSGCQEIRTVPWTVVSSLSLVQHCRPSYWNCSWLPPRFQPLDPMVFVE